MSWPSWLPLKESLADLTPYGAPQIEGVISLNTNENPFPVSPELTSAMLAALEPVIHNLNRYPDRDAEKLRRSLATYISHSTGVAVGMANIWAANGSNEILQTLMLALGSRSAIGFLPSYSVHPLIARTTGVKWISGSRRGDFTLDLDIAISEITQSQPSLIFITTPNNPTGNALRLSEIELLAKAAGEVRAMLVVDEAYAEFSEELSAVSLLEKYPHLVVVRTMSKAFAFAGARVGYAIADAKTIEAMLITRLPYHLSAQTQALALVALDHADELLREVAQLRCERDRMVSSMHQHGFQTIPSSANFILFSGFSQEPAVLWQSLLEKGILIRDVGISGYLRVSIGTPEENTRFLESLFALK
jgi:histidinol-phosphate aminotransferase